MLLRGIAVRELARLLGRDRVVGQRGSVRDCRQEGRVDRGKKGRRVIGYSGIWRFVGCWVLVVDITKSSQIVELK
jgi:hypothetical protein